MSRPVLATLLDYGAGNLHSLRKALVHAGAEVRTETDAARALDTEVLVVAGVGAFGPAARALAPARGLLRAALADGLPGLGICLGMQLLFETSEEAEGQGLGLFPGRVTRLAARQVPHMGWNTVEGPERALTASGLTDVYYANSFACRPSEAGVVTAWTQHEQDRFPAVVRKARTVGVQFHPEKSSAAGLRLLAALLEEVRR
jgi:imidazole glycerol-phosphate synthase subunit HisH